MSSTPKPKNHPVCGAVRELRSRLGLSQMDFAHKLRCHIVTLARYETTRPPKGAELAKLANVAIDHGHSDLAAVFYRDLIKQSGLGGMNLHFVSERFVVAQQGDELDIEAAVSTFIEILADPRHAKLRDRILGLMEGMGQEKGRKK